MLKRIIFSALTMLTAVTLTNFLAEDRLEAAGPGQPTNVEILERAAKLCDEVGRPIATPSQAAELMRVKG